MAKERKSPEIKLRLASVETNGEDYLPFGARALYREYANHQQAAALRSPLKITLEGVVPPSLNHQYFNMRNGARVLKPEIRAFRERVSMSMDSSQKNWRPIGAMAGIGVIYSPLWITKKLTVRDTDADNRIKALLDAWVRASGFTDSAIWDISCFKAICDRTYTLLYLFDLGDVVPIYRTTK